MGNGLCGLLAGADRCDIRMLVGMIGAAGLVRTGRLLQGDVGSGKTAVLVLAGLDVVASGFKCVIMAPTEILATQHYSTIRKMVPPEIRSVSAASDWINLGTIRTLDEHLAKIELLTVEDVNRYLAENSPRDFQITTLGEGEGIGSRE